MNDDCPVNFRVDDDTRQSAFGSGIRSLWRCKREPGWRADRDDGSGRRTRRVRYASETAQRSTKRGIAQAVDESANLAVAEG